MTLHGPLVGEIKPANTGGKAAARLSESCNLVIQTGTVHGCKSCLVYLIVIQSDAITMGI